MSGWWTALVNLLANVSSVWRKWTEKKAAPAQQHRERQQQIDKDVATGNPMDASVHGAADLDELDRLHVAQGGGDPVRPGGGTPPVRDSLHPEG